jgi:hypothetical protein
LGEYISFFLARYDRPGARLSPKDNTPNLQGWNQGMPGPIEIHFVYFQGCPIAPEARLALSAAVEKLGLDCRIVDVDTVHAAANDPMAHYPSPTFLVNGRELFGNAQGEASCCRIYPAGSLEPRALATEIKHALDLG